MYSKDILIRYFQHQEEVESRKATTPEDKTIYLVIDVSIEILDYPTYKITYKGPGGGLFTNRYTKRLMDIEITKFLVEERKRKLDHV